MSPASLPLRLKAAVAVSYALAFALALTAATEPASCRSARGGASQDDSGCKSCVSQAASLFASGKSSEAVELLRGWQSRCPNNSQLHLLLSTILIRERQSGPEAEQAAQAAVRAAPSSVAARLQHALALMGNSKNVAAVEEFEKVTELDPGNYEAWSSLSSLYGTLHEDEKARASAEKAANLEPGTRTVRLRTLKNLTRAGRTGEARVEVKRLIEGGECGPEFMQQLAEEAANIGAFEAAIAAGMKVSQAYPRSLAPLKTIALAQLSRSDPNGCLASADKMLAIDRDSAEALSLQALALAKQGQVDQAEKRLTPALKRQPDCGLALWGLGLIQFVRGEFQTASESLQQALDADPSLARQPDLSFTLAQALDKQGEREFSLSYYKQSLARGLSGQDADAARTAIERLSPSGK